MLRRLDTTPIGCMWGTIWISFDLFPCFDTGSMYEQGLSSIGEWTLGTWVGTRVLKLPLV